MGYKEIDESLKRILLALISELKTTPGILSLCLLVILTTYLAFYVSGNEPNIRVTFGFCPCFFDRNLLCGSFWDNPWSIFTYALVHTGNEHLWGNILGILIFGYFVEKKVGTKEFFAIAILSSFLSLGQLVVKTGYPTCTYGEKGIGISLLEYSLSGFLFTLFLITLLGHLNRKSLIALLSKLKDALMNWNKKRLTKAIVPKNESEAFSKVVTSMLVLFVLGQLVTMVFFQNEHLFGFVSGCVVAIAYVIWQAISA